MQNIKKITASETLSVRHPVLRAGKSIDSCHFNGDNLETTSHFGLFDNNDVIGVVSIFNAKNDLFVAKKQFQIRGMGILKQHQKKGFGEKLIHNSEQHCKNENANLIWFNARKEAIGFYEKMGYQVKGLPFEIPEVGEHLVMFKKLSDE